MSVPKEHRMKKGVAPPKKERSKQLVKTKEVSARHVPSVKSLMRAQLADAKGQRLSKLLSMARPLVAQRSKLAAEKAIFDQKYVLLDNKGSTSLSALDAQVALVDSQLRELRAIARTEFGFHPNAFNLYSIFYFNTTAGGLVASAVSLDPSGLSEFTTLAALFDEFKVTGGRYTYINMSYITATGTSLNSFGTVAYDPTDGSTPPSLVSMSQLQQHQLYFKTVLVAATTNPFTRDTHQVFNWKVPPGVITSVGATAASGTSSWQPTGVASPQPYGWLKAYFDGLGASTTALSGQLCYHAEFRCRE